MRGSAIWAGLIVAGLAGPAAAQEFTFDVPGASADLDTAVKGASLVRQAVRGDTTPGAADLFASAREDYARILGTLYDQGYFSGTISIRLNGREAATIQPIDAPETIRSIDIQVIPGPRSVFSHAGIGPVAPKTTLPVEYRQGETARTGVILNAATTGVSGWRDEGHAKAKVGDQRITVDHRRNTVSSDIYLAPGPVTYFGELHAKGNQRLRTERLMEIAGYPTGEKFTPKRMEEVRNRLRRTGIFSSVTLTEAETLRNGNLLDAQLQVAEDKRRRLGFGVEYGTSDGVSLSGYWLHRNLLGGGERLRFDAEITGIGGTTGGTDYALGVRLDRPATFTPDTSGFVVAKAARDHEEDYVQRSFTLGAGLSHIFNERLTGEIALQYQWAKVTYDRGDEIYRYVSLPGTLTWDNRDIPSDATRGYYGKLGLTPFYGLDDNTGSGLQLTADARAYKGFGENNSYVLAGRLQVGGVFGPGLSKTPRDYLFYSGGGGTVRGQPYQSLGVYELYDGTLKTGGTRFIGVSGEFRASVTQSIGVVAFYDAGYVSAQDYLNDSGEWQSGAGLGLRYKTPIGPIRLDIAGPVSGGTGDGAQLYLGIGQAF
ncbi:autotransporter assembly complex protein TamA [Paenirhodobacter sp.]|uniref:autotransporter assembly complex protein TamA n=1 Tax=Paenirhodobacter sp. TaxID=1965326 RepID=UPI003B3F1889